MSIMLESNNNYISTSLPDKSVKELVGLHVHYFRKYWCYEKAYKKFRRRDLTIKLVSSGAIGAGVTAGGITLNPIILGVLVGGGVLLKVFSDFKNYSRQVEMCSFACTSYQKILNEIRAYLRGQPYNHLHFVESLKITDDVIIDVCPSISHYEKKFDKLCKKKNVI